MAKKKKNTKKIHGAKLIALILMLVPGVALIGFLIYVFSVLRGNWTLVEMIIAILTIPFGFFAAIFLWLNALGIINI